MIIKGRKEREQVIIKHKAKNVYSSMLFCLENGRE